MTISFPYDILKTVRERGVQKKMTLKELHKTKYPKVKFIGIYTKDSNGNVNPIYPEYADEMIETHGDKEVKDYQYSEKHKVLVVEF